MLFCLHHNTSFSLQTLFHPCLLKTAMTRIVHGIRMMKGIMLTSSLHLLARWGTAPDHGIPLTRFLAAVPDWSVLDKMALDNGAHNAIRGLTVPVIGPAPFGISVHDAIKVKLHDFLLYYIVNDIVYDIVCMLYCIRYRILYTVYDIVYYVVYYIVYDIVCISPHV